MRASAISAFVNVMDEACCVWLDAGKVHFGTTLQIFVQTLGLALPVWHCSTIIVVAYRDRFITAILRQPIRNCRTARKCVQSKLALKSLRGLGPFCCRAQRSIGIFAFKAASPAAVMRYLASPFSAIWISIQPLLSIPSMVTVLAGYKCPVGNQRPTVIFCKAVRSILCGMFLGRGGIHFCSAFKLGSAAALAAVVAIS